MRQQVRVRQLLKCMFLLLVLSQCGGKTKSSMVDIQVAPGQPIVFTSTLKTETQTVTAPWFKFKVKLTNDADETLTIVALTVTTSIIDMNGKLLESTPRTFDPSENNYTDANGWGCNFTKFIELAPGQTEFLKIYDASGCADDEAMVFFMGGNPTNPNVTSFRYRVVIKPEGFFGTEDDPTDRFDRTYIFYTQ